MRPDPAAYGSDPGGQRRGGAPSLRTRATGSEGRSSDVRRRPIRPRSRHRIGTARGAVQPRRRTRSNSSSASRRTGPTAIRQPLPTFGDRSERPRFAPRRPPRKVPRGPPLGPFRGPPPDLPGGPSDLPRGLRDGQLRRRSRRPEPVHSGVDASPRWGHARWVPRTGPRSRRRPPFATGASPNPDA